MPNRNVVKTYCLYHIFFKLQIILIAITVCLSSSIETVSDEAQDHYSFVGNSKNTRLFKRNSARKCHNSSECSSEISGSVCLHSSCVCPQGYLPIRKGVIGCFQVGKHLGKFCNTSVQCGDEFACVDHVCLCPVGFQLFQTQGTNLCLLWHKPTRIVDRCRSNEDCTTQDPNSVCKKRWCHCNNGHQLFETMLFGRKQRCFKTHKFQCLNSTQCNHLAESPDHYCMCYYGVCHCITDMNFTALDILPWADKPTWYQRWKKDLILATRLLFITVILFFVPCFIYITLGMRERSRQLFSQIMRPTRSPTVHYAQRRPSHVGSNALRSAQAHQVEIVYDNRNYNTRLREELLNPEGLEELRRACARMKEVRQQQQDLPPSYEEIMTKDPSEEPPPPYKDI